MKTIFIALFQGVEAKNILRTDIYKILIANPYTRLVFFVGSAERASYYQKEFSHSRVSYEAVTAPKPSGLDKVFSILKFYLLKTETSDLRRKMAFQVNKNPFWFVWNWLINIILAHRLVRKVVRWLDFKLVKTDIFKNYFEKYNPGLIFCAHLFDDLEVHFLREARKRNIKTIGFVNSWDKLTARNIMRLLPDRLIVFSDITKEEAKRYADMPVEGIFVSGIPQYDWHVNYRLLGREEFFSKKGLDISKKLIVYAPMGKAFSNSDWDIIDLLHNSITDNIIKKAHLFVRFPPNDFVDEQELSRRPWLKYDYPGTRFSQQRGVDWDMGFDDIKGLTDTLANCDLFVCYASSMSIDAAVFDKPVINIDFEVRQKELMSKSPTYFYKMTHYAKAVRTGGIRYPKSQEEFVRDINRYLSNPELDREKRKRLVQEQCWKVDGRSAQRVADFILSYAD